MHVIIEYLRANYHVGNIN